MNKFVKGCIIGTAFYGVAEASFQIGKGYMLGTLAKYDCPPNELIPILAADKRRRSKFVSNVAKLAKK